MKVTSTKLDTNKTQLEIQIPQSEVAKAVEKAYLKLASKINIPGFRKGKAPRKILEMRIGKEALLDEAFEILAGPAYNQALDEQKIDPITRPEVEVVTLQEDQDLVFKATVISKPEVTLGQYKGLKVEQAAVAVTDEQVDAQLETMRTRQAKMVVAEGAEIQDGDFAIIDFKGFVDDVAFEGGEGQAHPLQIGSGSFIPGFEEQLIGAKAGDEVDVKVTFPAEYHAPDLAGKEALFKVTVQDVKRKELPALDDDFAKDAGDFETLEALKADTKNKLEQTATEKAERDFRNEAIKQAVENATMDIPEIMVENRIDTMINDLSANLEGRGMKLEQYMQYLNMDMAKLRENYRESALINVQTDLLLEAIVKAEQLEIQPEDVQTELAAMAQAYGATPEQVEQIIREQRQVAAMTESILRKKAAELIIANVEKA